MFFSSDLKKWSLEFSKYGFESGNWSKNLKFDVEGFEKLKVGKILKFGISTLYLFQKDEIWSRRIWKLDGKGFIEIMDLNFGHAEIRWNLRSKDLKHWR